MKICAASNQNGDLPSLAIDEFESLFNKISNLFPLCKCQLVDREYRPCDPSNEFRCDLNGTLSLSSFCVDAHAWSPNHVRVRDGGRVLHELFLENTEDSAPAPEV